MTVAITRLVLALLLLGLLTSYPALANEPVVPQPEECADQSAAIIVPQPGAPYTVHLPLVKE
jgi:hypothetical protein